MSDDEQMRARMLAYTTRVRELVGKDGWMVQGVFPTEPGDVWLAYTVGLTDAGLPELFMAGLSGGQLHGLLNALAARHIAREIVAGATVRGVGSVPLRVIGAPRAPIGFARQLYGVRASAVQVVWPDDEGRWPGTPRWRANPVQPLFGDVWWIGRGEFG